MILLFASLLAFISTDCWLLPDNPSFTKLVAYLDAWELTGWLVTELPIESLVI
jgi:hypothetical protein